MARVPKCKVCGSEIVESLSEVEGATDWLCLECSGATLADFMEEGMSEEDESEHRVYERRMFHGHK